MALDAATFAVYFPEFAEVAESLPDTIELYIVEAQAHCSAAFFGAAYERAVHTMAAHLLSMTPLGEGARLEPGDTTTYRILFDELKRSRPVAMLVGGVKCYGN